MPVIRCSKCGNSMVLPEAMAGKVRFCEDCGAPLEGAPEEIPKALIEPTAPLDEDVPVARIEDAPTFGAPSRALAPPAFDETKRAGKRRWIRPLRRGSRLKPSMTPGGVNLGPLDFGGAISNTFTILFKKVGHYLLLAVAVAFPIHFLTVLATVILQKSGEEGDPTLVALGFLITAFGTLLAGTFLNGCLAHSIAKHYIEEPVGIGDSISKALSQLHIIIGATLLMWLVVFSGFFLIIPIAMGGSKFSAFAFLVLFGWAIPALILYLSFFVYIPSILLENLGPVESLKRSWSLMRGVRLRTFGVMFVINLIFGAANVPFHFGATFLTMQGQPGEYITLATSPLIQSLHSLAWAAIIVVTYFDGRVRKEGFGVKNLVELFE